MEPKTFVVVVVSLLLACLVSLSSQIGPRLQVQCPASSNPDATTPDLRDIFIGRCHFFLNILHATDCGIVASNYDCEAIWQAFRGAIVGKDPCDVMMSDFDRFLTLVDHPIPANKSIFWSGTYTQTHEYAQQFDYWSLEDSFAGYLLNELSFCSAPNLTDFSQTSCPLECGVYNISFWNAASLNFAKKSTGVVTVMLNGTRTIGAVSNTSTFLNYELPQFERERVSELRVYLLLAPGGTIQETCARPKSLRILAEKLAPKNIKLTCIDNPEEIVYFMCFQNPTSKECDYIKTTMNGSPSSLAATRPSLLLLMVLSLAFLY